MGRIAEAAGCSRQLLYFHFDGRGELLLELSRRIDEEVRTPGLQARVDRADGPLGGLGAMVEVQGEIKPAIDAIVRAMERLAPDDADVAATLAERELARWGRTRAVVERLAEAGELRDQWTVEAATDLAWSVTSQRAWHELVVDRGWSTEQWVTRTTQALRGALSG
jgi:AcrR family transcriptional regulator